MQQNKGVPAGYTPGPWLVEDPLGSGAGDHLWIVQEGETSEVYDWRNLAVVCSDDPDEPDTARPITIKERDANARLIAAAPELLEALQMVVATQSFNSTEVLNEVLTVIRKAKARSPESEGCMMDDVAKIAVAGDTE